MRALVVFCVLLSATPALAHGDPTTVFFGTWTTDFWIIVPLYISGSLYLVGTTRLWARAGHGKGIRPWQVVAFWCGWSTLALALLSPLHWLGERLFTAHMVEHTVIMTVVAPLLAAARPFGAGVWSLPNAVRRAIGSFNRSSAVAAIWRGLRDPFAAALLHGTAIWVWHMPAFYRAVLENVVLHRLQHFSFFATAMLFWWSLFFGGARERRYGAAIFCLFVSVLHTGVLGIAITLSRRLWYPEQGAFAADWGLTPLEDQQLAGLVMWVPMGFVYTAAALLAAARWIRSGRPAPWEASAHAAAH